MIDTVGRSFHLSYEQGSGGTSLCLTIAKKYLMRGNTVLWLSKTLPDSQRTAQILQGLNDGELENIIFIPVEINLEESSKSLKYFTKNMGYEDIIIVDDWCAKTGKANKNDVTALTKIISDNKTNIIATSTCYSKVNGNINQWESRGGKKIKDYLDTVFLYRISDLSNVRLMKDREVEIKISLEEIGFV